MSKSSFNRTAKIQNQRGLHARAAAKFVKTAAKFEADISVTKGCQTVSGRSIMGLMMLAAGIGSEVSIAVEGPDAADAIDSICLMIDNKFDEE